MISECIMGCQIFENLVKITYFTCYTFPTVRKMRIFHWIFRTLTCLLLFKKTEFLFYLPKYLAILSGPYCKAFTKVWKTQYNSLENGADLKFWRYVIMMI